MSGINRKKISLKIYKQLEKKGLLKEIQIFRIGKNAFGETEEKLFVCNVKAFYYRKDTKINYLINTSGTINKQYNDKLLVGFSEESQKIRKDDFFVLQNDTFKIIDTGNIEDIVFDMYLERIV
ncbi:hypothetical protein FDJ70_07595 [Clostridium botulinum]|uniref:hypothetical protein n=1 Tax=Clostridium TaxID=1485 RepID=UPI0004D7A37C|nr:MULTISPECIES: hypothetical protein [Clostridium]KEI08065.1 hypothetical protein Z958_p0147 [Clostridium novyi B str. NCTC 9691]KEI12790.1 hypothetical protein Z958_05855 [Clostridium novyi B str. NCTC 9691]MCD3217483.1 hypothetical protein [Clostridium botulinum C]NFV47536.1 hypothetical protein [Clostridium botulinum]